MKHPLALAFTLALATAAPAQARETVISDDGREVLLRDDGTWEYVSEDRFATTPGGGRVRLKADGSWDIVTGDEAGAVIASPAPVHPGALPAGPLGWALDDVTIETARSKKSASKKGSTKVTQTVFLLRLRLAEDAAATTWQLRDGDLRVTDSSGRDYPILAISPDSGALAPGEGADITVRVDGSPHWFTTRFFEVRIDAGAAGSREDLRLRRSLSTVLHREVDELPR